MGLKLWDALIGLFKPHKKTAPLEPPKPDVPSTTHEGKQEGQSSIYHRQDSTVSRRNQDMTSESELGKFLDKHLYKELLKSGAFKSITRETEKDVQLNGVDVTCVATNGAVYRIDEKAQLYYINKNLPTFAFEVDFLRDGLVTIGWLCNPALLTDAYLLIWPYATQNTPKGIQENQFTEADCILVSKQRILNFLEQNGLTIERMLADAHQFRKERRTGKIPIPGLHGVYYFASYPNQYKEAPINIVIAKKYLREIAWRKYVVTPNGMKKE